MVESYLVIGAGVIFLDSGVAVDCGLMWSVISPSRIGRHENPRSLLAGGSGD